MSEEDRLQLEQECLFKYSKAQVIEKYIDEFEENLKLSELWCKSQQENKQLKEDKKKAREYIKNGLDFKSLHFIKGQDEDMWKIILIDNIKQDLLRILGDKENE